MLLLQAATDEAASSAGVRSVWDSSLECTAEPVVICCHMSLQGGCFNAEGLQAADITHLAQCMSLCPYLLLLLSGGLRKAWGGTGNHADSMALAALQPPKSQVGL